MYSPKQLKKFENAAYILQDVYYKFKEQIFQLFQIDLLQWFELEFIFTYKLNINPIMLDELEYYRVEYLFENYKEWLNKEKEARDKDESKSGHSLTQKEMMKDAQKNIGDYSKNMPSASNLNIPSNFKFSPTNFGKISSGFKI